MSSLNESSDSIYSEGDYASPPPSPQESCEALVEVIEINSSQETEESDPAWDGQTSAETSGDEDEDWDEKEEMPRDMCLSIIAKVMLEIEKINEKEKEREIKRRLSRKEVEKQLYFTLVDLFKFVESK